MSAELGFVAGVLVVCVFGWWREAQFATNWEHESDMWRDKYIDMLRGQDDEDGK